MQMRELADGIYRIEVPFEDIYTAVFAVGTPEHYLLIDCATTAEDVDDCILPTLRTNGFDAPPTALLLTHRHGDHAGGAYRLREHLPHLPIFSPEAVKQLEVSPISGGEGFLDRIEAIPLPGHTEHCVGYLDHQTKTLLTGDSLQQRGVSKYRDGIRYPALY